MPFYKNDDLKIHDELLPLTYRWQIVSSNVIKRFTTQTSKFPAMYYFCLTYAEHN